MTAFDAGDIALWRGQAVSIEECAGPTSIVLDPRSQDLVQVPTSELQPLPKKADPIANGLPTIPKGTWTRAARLAAQIKRMLELPEGLTEAVVALAKAEEVTTRTIWRAIRRYRKSPLTSDLMPRSPGRKAGCRILDVERERLIAQIIQSDYLRAERPSVAHVCEEVASRCRAAGWTPPNRATIKARIAGVDLERRLRAREGAKTAKETCEAVPGHVDVNHALERVEIDHTLVDVILRADTATREVLGRPWVTVAIDVYTRLVLGFFVSFARPCAASVALCLAQAVLPKDTFLRDCGVVGTWPARGVMREIWVDNALEFHSVALRRGCEQYQISLNYRPVGSPGIGGTIERLIGTLMGQCHLLPGTTHSSVADKGEYDAEARATLTLRQFVVWFTEQVVTQYHLNVHRTLGTSPRVAWEQQEAAGFAPTVPANAIGFLATFLPGARRKLTRTGVQIHNETYWSATMSPWVGQGKKVLVTYHPNTVRGVFVRLPDGTVVPATVTRSSVPDVTVEDWQRTRRTRQSAATDPLLVQQKDAGRDRNRQRVEEARRETRRALRQADVPPPDPPKSTPAPALVPELAAFGYETLYF